MRTLRTGLVAVILAALTSLGLVVSTAGAAAADPVPADPYADLDQSLHEANMQLPGAFLGYEVLSAVGIDLAPQSVKARQGTAEEVKLGQKVTTSPCKGWTCSILPAIKVLNGLGVWGWFDEEKVPGVMTTNPQAPSAVTWRDPGNTYKCMRIEITDADWSDGFSKYKVTSLGDAPQNPVQFGPTACSPDTAVDAECVKTATGVLRATTGVLTGPVASGASVSVSKTFCAGDERPTWVRQRATNFTSGTSKVGHGWESAFEWGERRVGPNDVLWARATCQDAVGDTYTVEVLGEVGRGIQPVPQCRGTDEMNLLETGLRRPDGSTRVDSVTNLMAARQSGLDAYPDCAAGCEVAVHKTDGTKCTRGQVGCVNWTTDKASFECRYGSHVVALSACNPWERAYEQKGTSKVPASRGNVDGVPTTWEGPAPNWNPTPAPTPTTAPSTTSSPTPTTSPTVQPSPEPSPTSPSPTSTIVAPPDPDPTSTGSPTSTPTSSPTSTSTPGGNPGPSPSSTSSTSPDPSTSPSASSSPSPSSSSSASPSTSPSPSSSPSPSASSSTPTDVRAKPPAICSATVATRGLGSVSPALAALVADVDVNFDLGVVGGYREDADTHTSGLAADFMVNGSGTNDHAMGQAIATYLQQNAPRLGVRYLIWEQRIWNTERADEGWRLMADRGSPTQNHFDHVHVTIYGDAVEGVSCLGDPLGAGPSCLPDGWTWNPVHWVLEPTKCAIRWAFVPDPEKVREDLDDVGTAWSGHPPGSIIEGIRPVLSEMGGMFSGNCVMPNFSPDPDIDVTFPCEPPQGNPWSSLYLAAQGIVVTSTALKLWSMVAAGVSARATGE